MPENKDLLDKRKQSLLLELESIKHLLDDTTVDTIPVLEQAVFTDDNGQYIDINDESSPIESNSHRKNRVTPNDRSPSIEAKELRQQYGITAKPHHTHKAVLPPSIFNPKVDTKSSTHEKTQFNQPPLLTKAQQVHSLDGRGQQTLGTSSENIPPHSLATPPTQKKAINQNPAKTLNNNPFLPKHVRQRLDREANTTKATLEKTITSPHHSHTENVHNTGHLVDQLIAQYLPRIEAELRKRLINSIKDHDKKPF